MIEELIITFYKPFLETIYMVFYSTLFSLILGIPIGILIIITQKNSIKENYFINQTLSVIVNITRSLPFIILMILVFPLSRLLLKTSIGTTASIIPLSIAATPFVARIIENSLCEVSKGKLEAAISMGSSTFDIVFKVLIPESLSSIILGITIAVINILGYSAMAGAIGAGGLGDLAIRYGFYRFDTKVMIISVIIIIFLVQIIQTFGNFLAICINKKIGKI